MGRALAAQLPASCRRPPPAGHPPSITQAGGSSRPMGGAVAAPRRLVLGGLDEENGLVEFDVDCDADIRGYDCLHAHDRDPSFLYDCNEVCLCAQRGCTSGRRVRLDLSLAYAPASGRLPGRASRLPRPANSSAPSASARFRRSAAPLSGAPRAGQRDEVWPRGVAIVDGERKRWPVGGEGDAADEHWRQPSGSVVPVSARPASVYSAKAAVASAVTAADCRPVRRRACGYAAGPAAGLRPSVLIKTGMHPIPRSLLMKRWSQGELDECRKPALADSPSLSRPPRESLKTPSRAESRDALNKTEPLSIESCDCLAG